jgi:hypothetical protein
MQNHSLKTSKQEKHKSGDIKYNSEVMPKNNRGISHSINPIASPYNESLSTPGGSGQSAFVSRDRGQGGIFQNNGLK